MTSAMDDQGQLEVKLVERQAGGHFAANGDHIMPNLQRSDGTFLKLIRDSPRYHREVSFYQSVFSPDLNNKQKNSKELSDLRKLLPGYYGIFNTLLDGQKLQYMVLEDLTGKFEQPCVLDIKLKADVHDPNSTNQHQVFPIATKLGFLIDGITVYNSSRLCYESSSKSFGRNLTEGSVQSELSRYVNGSAQIVQSFLRKLSAVESWAQGQRSYHFYRSSLLFVYDASALQRTPFETIDDRTDIRFIDFAKVQMSDEADTELIKCIKKLKMAFEQLLQHSN